MHSNDTNVCYVHTYNQGTILEQTLAVEKIWPKFFAIVAVNLIFTNAFYCLICLPYGAYLCLYYVLIALRQLVYEIWQM